MTAVKQAKSRRAARTDAKPSSNLESPVLDTSLGYSIRRAQLSTYPDFLEFMEKFDIRPAQFTVLALIHSNPGLRQATISEALGIQPANFVPLLDKLEQRGLTERRKVDGDRRSSALYLTRKGELFVEVIEQGHREMESRLVSRLGLRRSAQFLKLLQEFTSAGSQRDGR